MFQQVCGSLSEFTHLLVNPCGIIVNSWKQFLYKTCRLNDCLTLRDRKIVEVESTSPCINHFQEVGMSQRLRFAVTVSGMEMGVLQIDLSVKTKKVRVRVRVGGYVVTIDLNRLSIANTSISVQSDPLVKSM